MKQRAAKVGQFLLGPAVLSLVTLAGPADAQTTTRTHDTDEIRVIVLQGKVEIMRTGAANWVVTTTDQSLRAFDRLHVLSDSRVSLRWAYESVVTLGELTEIEVLPAPDRDALPGLHLMRGLLSFFHRDKPGRIRVLTRGADAGIEGTEFVMEVDFPNGRERTSLWVIDGKVELNNGQGPPLSVTNGWRGTAEQGQAPNPSPGFNVNNRLQWCFYYPAVLDLDELAPVYELA